MDVDERARHELYTQLVNTMGTEAADTLMSNLPPSGWADMATKQDVAVVKQDVALVKQDVAHVRSDLTNLEERVTSRIEAVESNLDERMTLRLEAVESRLEARMDRQLRDQTRVIVFSMVASMAAFAGIVVTAG